MVASQAQQQLYTHAAEPKAVQQRKPKYREEDTAAQQDASILAYPANIMFDKRVVRGNTYAARILPADTSLTSTSTRKPAPGSLRSKATGRVPPRTPDAVEGRKHMDVQTDSYLEELTDTVPEQDTQTQTDAFLDRPPTPLFIPAKTGVDATTQIAQGDLFDFDFEVEPILEVLVGKVLEQGLMEVLEEEELAAMRAHQEHFEALRNAELVATQRMEAAEKRRAEEKDRRLAQEVERQNRQRVVRQKVAASTFARGYLSGIVTTVFDQLQMAGFFYDPVQREVDDSFMPWLAEQAVAYLEQGMLARQVATRLVASAAAALEHTRQEADARVAAEAHVAEQWAARQAAAKAAAEKAELEDIRSKAALILRELQPPVAPPETVDAVREELVAAAQAEADAAHEAAKAAASDAARATAEARAAEQAARLEELRAAAAEAAAAAAPPVEEEGQQQEEAAAEELPPAEELLGEPLVDVEAEAAKAAEAVVRKEPKEVTDSDVMSALLDRGLIGKDAIIQSLAIHSLGDAAYTRHPLFAPTPAP